MSRAAFALLLVLTLAGCAPGVGDSDVDRVRVVLLPYLTNVPLQIAAEEGFFADEGLDVEFIRLSRNQEIMTALAIGVVQDGTPSIPAYSSAVRMRAAVRTGNPSSLKATAPPAFLLGHLGDALPLEAVRDRPDREDAAGARLARALEDAIGDRDVVVHRVGVRHAGHRGEPARGGGAGPALDVLLVLLARLAEVDVHVDEAGGHDEPPGVQDLVPGPGDDLGRGADDPPLLDEEVEPPVGPIRWVDEPSAFNEQWHLPPSPRTSRPAFRPPGGTPPPEGRTGAPRPRPTAPASRYRMAIRQATLYSTCSRMTEKGPSATSGAISTPRLIGPGCMMRRSGLAARRRLRVMP